MKKHNKKYEKRGVGKAGRSCWPVIPIKEKTLIQKTTKTAPAQRHHCVVSDE